MHIVTIALLAGAVALLIHLLIKCKLKNDSLMDYIEEVDDNDGSIQDIDPKTTRSKQSKRKAKRFNRKKDRIQDRLNRKRRWIRKNT